MNTDNISQILTPFPEIIVPEYNPLFLALASGFLVLLGLTIIAFAGWRYYVIQNRRGA